MNLLIFERSNHHGFLKSLFLVNLKKRLAIYVTSRQKKFNFYLSCQPSTWITFGMRCMGWKILLSPAPVGVDSGSGVSVMNSPLCLLNLTLNIDLSQKAPKRKDMHIGQWCRILPVGPSQPQTSIKGSWTVVADQTSSSFVPGLTTASWYFPSMD